MQGILFTIMFLIKVSPVRSSQKSEHEVKRKRLHLETFDLIDREPGGLADLVEVYVGVGVGLGHRGSGGFQGVFREFPGECLVVSVRSTWVQETGHTGHTWLTQEGAHGGSNRERKHSQQI